MWYLTSDHDTRVLYILQQSLGVTVGRTADAQNCNFAIPNDQSISRKHATLTVVDNSLFIQNLGSKYGTFVNDQQLTDEKLKLKKGDIVKFGKLNSIWQVQVINFITCTSTLKGENLQTLKMNLSKLGGLLKSDWDDSCEYLTMPGITLTIKVVLALTQGSNIVTTEYWVKCYEAINNNSPLPNPRHFIPHIIESTLNKDNVSFSPDLRRATLFNGKKVIFFSKVQLDMYKPVLLKSSASPELINSSMTKAMLGNSDAIVIQHNKAMITQDSQSMDQINDIVNYLKGKGKRLVADAEIGLAILYCSIEKYCNPDFNFSSEVIKQQANGPAKQNNVLAKESQEPTQIIKRENVVIDESLVDVSGKRKLSDDSSGQENKKIATEINKYCLFANDTIKRKIDDKDQNDTQSKRTAIETADDDMFNFINPKEKKVEDTQKKLNLTKPSKRKFDKENNQEEENLFNFIEDSSERSSKKQMLEDNREIIRNNKKIDTASSSVDITALRGSKLTELMLKNNMAVNNYAAKVKVEETDDLDEKMNKLDLGTTILKVRNDLIVKKEPLEVEVNISNVKNFKKFKKVWPVKKQVTVIS